MILFAYFKGVNVFLVQVKVIRELIDALKVRVVRKNFP